MMKDYIQRLKSGCTKGQLVLWWIYRLLMIYALISTLLKNPSDIALTVRLVAGLAGMFLWEIFMAAKEKSFVRYIPSFLQTGFIICIFADFFAGEFLGLYDSIYWLVYAVQFVFGAVSIFFGYEIACAVIKRDKYYATKAMAFFVAFGLFYIWLNAIELSEFFLDQIIGVITGNPGDAQGWMSKVSEKVLIDPIDPTRFALMGIMTEIIVSTVGAFVGLLIVNIFPYRHRGKYKYDFDFSEKTDCVKNGAKNK